MKYTVEAGVDPTQDWRAPYIYWSRNKLMAIAAAAQEVLDTWDFLGEPTTTSLGDLREAHEQ